MWCTQLTSLCINLKHTIYFDAHIDMKIGLPRGDDGELYHAIVKSRAFYRDGKTLITETNNPINDTWLYEVE